MNLSANWIYCYLGGACLGLLVTIIFGYLTGKPTRSPGAGARLHKLLEGSLIAIMLVAAAIALVINTPEACAVFIGYAVVRGACLTFRGSVTINLRVESSDGADSSGIQLKDEASRHHDEVTHADGIHPLSSAATVVTAGSFVPTQGTVSYAFEHVDGQLVVRVTGQEMIGAEFKNKLRNLLRQIDGISWGQTTNDAAAQVRSIVGVIENPELKEVVDRELTELLG